MRNIGIFYEKSLFVFVFCTIFAIVSVMRIQRHHGTQGKAKPPAALAPFGMQLPQ